MYSKCTAISKIGKIGPEVRIFLKEEARFLFKTNCRNPIGNASPQSVRLAAKPIVNNGIRWSGCGSAHLLRFAAIHCVYVGNRTGWIFLGFVDVLLVSIP